MSPQLPLDLSRKILKAGYYPAFVTDVLDIALADEQVETHLVHLETTFDVETIRRHLSVVVLTPTRLIFVHADDHGGDEEHGEQSHGTVTIGWGAVARLDLEPATCGDPQCEADHGYTGSMTGDDLSLRVSADAEGENELADALAFARVLSAATASARV